MSIDTVADAVAVARAALAKLEMQRAYQDKPTASADIVAESTKSLPGFERA